MKKVLSLVLAVVMVLGMTSMAFAVDYPASDLTLGISGLKSPARPGDQVKVYITGPGGIAVTREDVSQSKITFQVKKTAGGSALQASEIKYDSGTGAAYIRLTLLKPYVATKEMDFNFEVTLLADKVRNATPAVVAGYLENETQNIDEYDDYVFVGDAPVVVANAYNKAIEVDLGDGVTIKARMFENKKYYGYVSQEIKSADQEIIDKYPDIDTVYYLSTIGLNNSGDVVTFDLDSNMFVYVQDEAGNLVYLGRTNKALPYYTKYFIAGKELAIETVSEPTDVIPGPDDVIGGTDNSVSGGDDVIANVNDNPGTGC